MRAITMANLHMLSGPAKLVARTPNEFDAYAVPYTRHIEPLIQILDQEARRTNRSLVRSYSNYQRWATRTLEYSFVLRHCNDRLKPETRVLDVGCGLSPLPRYFASRGCDTFGADIEAEALSIVTDPRSCVFDGRITYVMQSGTRLGLRDHSFDLITCVSVLEHLRRGCDTIVMKEMLRVLSPGGLLLVTVDFNGTHGSTLSVVNLLSRIANHAMVIVASGSKAFKRDGIAQFATEVSQFSGVMESGGPYSISEFYGSLIEPFAEQFGVQERREICERLAKASLNFIEIKRFWESQWFAGGSCARPRDYVPLGFVLEKDRHATG